ncbi:uncharacterized protein CTRU02_206581 [Colletotrichum truncatum]|uniref:Uncharacterized protein n=1 Tax=Colletotrichum truncatum TaxID=5467 RepID=A0ACC3Z7A4_COLTU|nr:uncharacterized protein CTRU02_11950 [Colletotrichum truncatum]KAF6785325.1 hypothetical protein CTRU02_11950 [Colletotrichum truncatum]
MSHSIHNRRPRPAGPPRRQVKGLGTNRPGTPLSLVPIWV